MYKVYDGKVKAVNDFNLEIEDKEFIVFVGPSGCGKSTTLRMVAGLEDISAGELWIGDTLCNHVEPKNRNIAMVFQNYALFPNMTVYGNIAFGLKMHKVPKDEIDKKVKWAAGILGITEYLNRKPKALSGGQRQRVALGRAIVREPNVFLFDEPLSNLDAKLRAKMRTEITRLHKRLQTTFIYVTHDQTEAMTMGDRIVVMKDGYIQQIDTPQNLFKYPQNKFVAGFIGTPQMNFFEVTLIKNEDETVTIKGEAFEIKLPREDTYTIDEAYLDGNKKVVLGIRPDDIAPVKEKTDKSFKATVALIEALGTQTLVYADVDKDKIMEEGSSTSFCSALKDDINIKAGDEVFFMINTSKIHLFDSETEFTIKRRLPEKTVKATLNDGVISLFGTGHKIPEAIKALANGEYVVNIPSGALYFASDGIVGQIENVESYGNKNIYRVCVGDERVFIASDEQHGQGEKVNIGLAFDKLTFIRADEVCLQAVERTVRFSGSFVKEKVGRETKHFIAFNGVKVECDYNFSQKMYDRGRSIFKKKLAFEIEIPYIKADDAGVPVSVIGLLDYENAKYVKVELGGQSFCIESEGADNVKAVSFELDKVKVYDTELDMRLF